MNEPYHTIRYLPIQSSIGRQTKITAILETCFDETTFTNILGQFNPGDNSYISDMAEDDEKIINILDQNTSVLSG